MGPKGFSDSFRRVIRTADPAPNSAISSVENASIKVLADYGRHACNFLDQLCAEIEVLETNATVVAQEYRDLQAENKGLTECIEMALLELSHVLAEKTPTEKRIEKILREQKKGNE